MLWIWDTLAMKQISSVEYPSFVERNTQYAKLAWSPDQRFIATVIGGSAQVYEVAAGKWVSHWSTGNSIDLQQGVAWSADSQYIATTFIGVTTQNNGVGVHDAITGKLVRSFPFPPTEHDGTGQRYSPIMCKTVSWSPDNRWLAGGGLIRNKKMDTYQVFFTIWDASSGTEVFSTSYTPATGIIDNGYQLYITVAWSPDGKQLAVASDTTGVKLWDVPRKKLLRTYIGSGGMFGEGLVWSPDGKYIAASEGNVVRIWDPASDQTLFRYRGHLGINGLSWSPRGNYIASSSLGSIRVWQPDINSF
jgi:WD40 repeat protein